MPVRDSTVRRRRVLETAAVGLVGTALAGCGGDGGGGDGGGGGDSPPEFDGFLDNADGYDGVVDETGSGEVTVSVGASGNGGDLAFDPVAIRVDSGTTVVWEWTGQGGMHNVSAEDGSFESDLVNEEGHTFSQAFEDSDTVKYACTPHRSVGMRGVVRVE